MTYTAVQGIALLTTYFALALRASSYLSVDATPVMHAELPAPTLQRKRTRRSRASASESRMLNLARLSRTRGSSSPADSESGEALQLLRTFEASSHGWFWSVDEEGRLTYLSESVAELLDASSAALLGKPLSEVFVPAEDDVIGRRTLSFLLSKRGPFEKIVLCPAKAGIERYWAVSGSPQFTASSGFTGYRGSAIDITEERMFSEHASQLAKYDPLTGLPNRRRMAEVLDAHLKQAEHQQRPCAVLLMDLDRFKHVNDTLGHPAGDALLTQVAERLVRIVGDRESVFRLGGDEFEIILPNCDAPEEISVLASRLISIVSQPYSIESTRCAIGASIGVAVAPADGIARAHIIRNADLALYCSKSSGGGNFKFFSADLLEAAEERRALEEDLREALLRDGISLAYQPIVHAVTNRITGVEALLRWNHPVKGPISPAVFVPIAEETGIIAQIGEWALRKACEDAASWPGTIRVAVNVSPVQFNGDSLPGIIVSALAASGLPPERLELEVTEGIFLGENPSTDALFTTLKEIGVRLALDDFGTGYASLGYLRKAPFDKIKIDQTFVREATLPTSRNGAIIAAIVALAEALGMETTAEGIEYMDQLELIRSLRVSHVQGWVYSDALSSAELQDRLADGQWAIEPSGPQKQRSSRQSVYRKVGVIHGTRYHSAIVRNLSETGALIEGLSDLPLHTLVLVDFGEGQLTFARVTRLSGRHVGVEFEKELVDDGSGNLCTGERVSPYLLASVGLPQPGDADKDLEEGEALLALDRLADRLGLASRPRRGPAIPLMNLQWSLASQQSKIPTVRELSKQYLDSLLGDDEAREAAEADLHSDILPQLGHLRLDQVRESDLAAWLSARSQVGTSGATDNRRLGKLLSRMWSLAADLKIAGTDFDSLQGSLRLDRRGGGEELLSVAAARELLLAARASQNRQLQNIISLLMVTGARTGEILHVQWEQVDLSAGLWHVAAPVAQQTRQLHLTTAAVALFERLPRFETCPYVVPNPSTRKPYRSLTQSWDAAKARANLAHLELDDLRYCHFGTEIWNDQLLPLVRKLEENA